MNETKDLCLHKGREIECLGTTKDGRPRHPLYVFGAARPVSFSARPQDAGGAS